MKDFCAAFLYLQFGFVHFWQKNIGAKAACKMLVKLTTGQPASTEEPVKMGPVFVGQDMPETFVRYKTSSIPYANLTFVFSERSCL